MVNVLITTTMMDVFDGVSCSVHTVVVPCNSMEEARRVAEKVNDAQNTRGELKLGGAAKYLQTAMVLA